MAPSWPPRLTSLTREEPTSRPERTPSSTHAHALSHRPRDTSRMSEFEVVDGSEIQVDSSSSDSDLKRTPASRPRHGRSLSHPFPSLFSSKKKKHTSPERGFGDSDSSDEARQSPPRRRGSSQKKMHRTAEGQGSKDFVTGNCMTCGSLVRWPKDLKVYKCTICLTVNDLEPLDLAPRVGRSASRHGDEADTEAWTRMQSAPGEQDFPF